MTTKTKKIFISILTITILLALAAYYIKTNISDFTQLSLATPLLTIPLIALFLVSAIITAILNQQLLNALKVKLTNLEAFSLSIITSFYNLITPFRGGAAARAVYLKKKHNFPYVNFLATLSAIYILVFLVASLIGIISTLIIYNQTGNLPLVIFIIFNAIFLSLLSIIITSPKIKERKNKWLNRFIKVVNGWHLIKNNKKVILTTTLLTFIQTLLTSLMLYLQFMTFKINVSFTSCLFLSAIGSLGMLISLTPGNLGVNEAIIVFSASTIGITPAQSLSAALLGRAVSLIVLFILGPIFSYNLIKSGTKETK